MADKDNPGLVCHTLPEMIDDSLIGFKRGRYFLLFIGKAIFLAQELPDVVTGPIFVVGGQDFIFRAKVQGAGDDVQGEGGIGDKDDIITIGIEIAAQALPGMG